jgi:putative transposase
MDFIIDSMVNGRKFRTFNLIDDCTVEVLAIEFDKSLSSKRLMRILERVILESSKPSIIRIDKAPDFTSKELELCEKDNKIQFLFST